jgi:hypothetical protein
MAKIAAQNVRLAEHIGLYQWHETGSLHATDPHYKERNF